MLAGAAAPLVVTGAWLWQIGAIDEARIAVVDFNRYYVTEGLATPAHALAFANGVWLRMKTDPVWAGGGLTSLVACWSLIRTRTLAPLPALALCWGAAATVVILVNGIRLFNSYFLQAYAPLCLMAAWWLADRRGSTGRRLAQGAVGLVMFVLLVSGVYPVRATERTLADWRRLTGQIGQTDYLHGFGGYANARGYSARANQEVADYIRSRTSEHDSIFLFGVNGAGIYFLAERITAHRFIRVNFFFPDGFPDPRFTVEAVTADLARRRPRYVLFEDLHASSAIGRAVSGVSTHPAVVGLLGDYEFETQIEDFAIYRRR